MPECEEATNHFHAECAPRLQVVRARFLKLPADYNCATEHDALPRPKTFHDDVALDVTKVRVTGWMALRFHTLRYR